MCEREIIRMLHILRHLFYQSKNLLLPWFTKTNMQQPSKLSNITNNKSKMGVDK